MSDTKELLQRIALLRTRLGQIAPSDTGRSVQCVEERVEQGSGHNRLLDAHLRVPVVEATPPVRLTARAARLLRRGKDLLQALREMTDDPALHADDMREPLAQLHRQNAGLIEVVLRAVQAFPPTPSLQLRLCEGLETVLETAEDRVDILRVSLALRHEEEARIDYLAEILGRLAVGQPVSLEPLQKLAEHLYADAQAGLPLRFLHAGPIEPARFAAAHGLVTAQVLARILLADPEAQANRTTALVAALVHDIGMVRLPADLIAQQGPLSDEGRRLMERHTTAGHALLAPLWPGGGWPIEAARDHHERSDGTGYPHGLKEIEVAPFARLLAVCDVYAALCAPRPHREPADSRTALTDVLLLAEHGVLERGQAERLLVLTFYPVGSVVELSDGAFAVVLAAHSRGPGAADPTRPLVQLLTGPRRLPLGLPGVVDLAQERDRHISRVLNRSERRLLLLDKFPQLI